MKSPKEIGGILKEARQKKGVNFDKIWKATRIQRRIAEALEEGRADEILDKVYTILFLRKYASFLELDGDNLAAEYKAFYTGPEEQILDISEKPKRYTIDLKKWMPVALYTGAAVLFLAFTMFLGTKMKSFYRKQKAEPSIVISKTTTPPQPIDKTLRGIFPIPKNKPVNLVLHATEDAWMKIRKDEKVIFEGTLQKDKNKNWSAESNIKLWVGRAEVVDFRINGTFVGKIGKGNIKNIEISRNGLKIGKKWIQTKDL